jgi:hypothetical protein
MNHRILLLLSACWLVLACGACHLLQEQHPESWEVDELEVPSERLLWEITVFALEKERFPVGSRLDPSTLTAISGWRNSLAPFRGKGRRERAEVRYEAIGPKLYRVHVRVEREINDDPVRPMDLSYAKWEKAPDNQEGAMVLLQRIRSWISPGLETKPPANTPGDPRE